MTHLDVVFRYASPPGETELRAINQMRDVYGIRRVAFNHEGSTVLVEYDASRFNEAVVASLLRRAGLDVLGKVALA